MNTQIEFLRISFAFFAQFKFWDDFEILVKLGIVGSLGILVKFGQFWGFFLIKLA